MTRSYAHTLDVASRDWIHGFPEYIALPDPVLCIGAAWTRVVGIAVTCRRHLPIEKPEPL